MISKSYSYSIINPFLRKRLIVFGIITVFFILGFVWNTAFFQSAFKYSAETVAQVQNDTDLINQSFLDFMDFISDRLFSPHYFQYYVMLFLIFSNRKLQVSVFMIWISFVYFVLENFKSIFHQPRPYMTNDSVQILADHCSKSYGMPSGHATLTIVFLDFLVKFYIRQYNFVWKTSYIWYLIAICLQMLVCASRVILGMHSLNQVLFGFMLGIFFCITYCYFFENLIMSWCLGLMNSKNRKMSISIISSVFLLSIIIDYLIAFVPQYDNQEFIINLNRITACGHLQKYNSFQYSSFKVTGYSASAFGTLYALLIINHPEHLMLKPLYSFFSWKSLQRIVLGLLTGGIPTWAFRTNLWTHLQNFDNIWLAVMTWTLFSLGCFLGPFCYLTITPILGQYLELQTYRYPQSFEEYKQDEVFGMDIQKLNQIDHQFELPGYANYHDELQGSLI